MICLRVIWLKLDQFGRPKNISFSRKSSTKTQNHPKAIKESIGQSKKEWLLEVEDFPRHLRSAFISKIKPVSWKLLYPKLSSNRFLNPQNQECSFSTIFSRFLDKFPFFFYQFFITLEFVWRFLEVERFD